MNRWRWMVPLVLGAVALVAVAAAFGISRATASSSVPRASTGAQSSSAGCARLMSNPASVKAMQPLLAEHVKDFKAWRGQYGKNPQSAVARAALKTMHQQHVREMQAAFKKLGIKVPAGACDISMMGGGTDSMMGGGADSMMGGGADSMMGGGADSMMGGGSDSTSGGSGATGDVHQQHHPDSGASPGAGASGTNGGATF